LGVVASRPIPHSPQYEPALPRKHPTFPERAIDVEHPRQAERAREKARKEKSVELPLKATDRLFGKALVKALAPKIEELRREEFGSPDPPFKTARKAAEWV
jgi:hypothetical protein